VAGGDPGSVNGVLPPPSSLRARMIDGTARVTPYQAALSIINDRSFCCTDSMRCSSKRW
jgi:hypothetical protein